MSYARANDDSDFYIYGTGGGWQLHTTDGEDMFFRSLEQLHKYLLLKQSAGYRVHPHTLERIEREIRMNIHD